MASDQLVGSMSPISSFPVIGDYEIIDGKPAAKGSLVAGGPKPVLAFKRPEPTPVTDADLVFEELRGRVKDKDVDGIVVLYRNKRGELSVISDQGDDAGTVYFIEQAKLKLLTKPAPREQKPA